MKNSCETPFGEVLVVTTQKPTYTWEVSVSAKDLYYSRFFFDQHSANIVHNKIKTELERSKTESEEELKTLIQRSLGVS